MTENIITFEMIKDLAEFGDNLLKENEELKEENEQLKSLTMQNIDDYTALKKVCNDVKRENEQLKSEIKMLKTIIGKNEQYIGSITHKGKWGGF